LDKDWTLDDFTPALNKSLEDYFGNYKKSYQLLYNKVVAAREKKMYDLENVEGSDYDVNEYKNKYYNESLADLVKNVKEKERIIEFNGHLIQQINPVFQEPIASGPLDYRAQFLAPSKNLLGRSFSTYFFNILVIWAMTAMFYIMLYFEALRKGIDALSNVSLTKKK
jgi:hypothetical protein